MDLTKVKQILENHCKQNHYKKPKYRITSIDLKDYQRLYTSSVEIKGVLKETGSGISRRIADKKAAINALLKFNVINDEEVRAQEEVIEDINDIESVAELKYEESDEEEVKENIEFVEEKPDPKSNKIIVLEKSSPSVLKPEMKPIDQNIDNQRQGNQLNNESKVQIQSPVHKNIKSEELLQLEENPICAIIKYCLRNEIPLPFYDFQFRDGQFCTQCRIETNGTEFIGFGRSPTLREAKMIASQEVIDSLKKINLYFNENCQTKDDNKPKILEINGYTSTTGFGKKIDNKVTEVSTVTINMKSLEPKTTENEFRSKSNTFPTKIKSKDKGFDERKYSSTLSPRDDNNNPKTFGRSMSQNLIIDHPISYLQKFCVKNHIKPAEYVEEAKVGQDHCPLFKINCTLNMDDRQITCMGIGTSKKCAKKAAAEEVVRLLLQSNSDLYQ